MAIHVVNTIKSIFFPRGISSSPRNMSILFSFPLNLPWFSEKVVELFRLAGFHTTSNEYITRETVNKKEGLCVPRIFVQSKFQKPHVKSSATKSEGDSGHAMDDAKYKEEAGPGCPSHPQGNS